MGGSTKDIALGVATGGLYPLINNQVENIRDAKRTAKAEAQDQLNALNAEKKRIAEQESQSKLIEERNRQRDRQKQRAIGALGRKSTILTSPLGLVGESETTGTKTLLGQ